MTHQSASTWSFSSSYSYSSLGGKEEAQGSVKESKNGEVVRDASFAASEGKMKITENGQEREEPWNGRKSLAQTWTRPTLRE